MPHNNASNCSSDPASTITDRHIDLCSISRVRAIGNVRFSGTYPCPAINAPSTAAYAVSER